MVALRLKILKFTCLIVRLLCATLRCRGAIHSDIHNQISKTFIKTTTLTWTEVFVGINFNYVRETILGGF